MYGLGNVGPSTMRHVERWFPARVLAGCDSKRRILRQVMRPVLDSDEGSYDAGWRHATDRILYQLLVPYINHPGFQQDWREALEQWRV